MNDRPFADEFHDMLRRFALGKYADEPCRLPVELSIADPQYPISKTMTRVMAISGHGERRFYSISEIANELPFRQAIDFVIGDHRLARDAAENRVKPSLVVPCPACDGGWRDTPTGTVMCGQCHGTGRRATNGGEA